MRKEILRNCEIEISNPNKDDFTWNYAKQRDENLKRSLSVEEIQRFLIDFLSENIIWNEMDWEEKQQIHIHLQVMALSPPTNVLGKAKKKEKWKKILIGISRSKIHFKLEKD